MQNKSDVSQLVEITRSSLQAGNPQKALISAVQAVETSIIFARRRFAAYRIT